MFIRPKAYADSVFEVSEDALIYSTSDDVVLPWEPDIEIKGEDVKITGFLLPGNANNFCTCECRVSNFSQFYLVEVPDEEGMEDRVREAGWEISSR